MLCDTQGAPVVRPVAGAKIAGGEKLAEHEVRRVEREGRREGEPRDREHAREQAPGRHRDGRYAVTP